MWYYKLIKDLLIIIIIKRTLINSPFMTKTKSLHTLLYYKTKLQKTFDVGYI